jgi:hypothetical protein
MKRVLSILVISLITMGAIQKAKAIEPTIREHFPITAAALAPAESEWHAALAPQFFYWFNKPENVDKFLINYAGLAIGDKSYYHYFQYPELQRKLIKEEFERNYKKELSYEEIAQIIKTAEIRPLEKDFAKHYGVLRIADKLNSEGKREYQFVTRNPYQKGVPIGEKGGYVPEYNELGAYQGDWCFAPVSCANLTYSLIKFGEPDGPYKPKKADTVFLKETIVEKTVEKQPINYYFGDTSKPSATATATATCNTCPSTVKPAEENHSCAHTHSCTCSNTKKNDGLTTGKIILGTAVGTTIGTVAGNVITRVFFPQPPVILNGGGGVYSNGGWQTPPIVYGNGGQGGAWDSPTNTNGGTTTTGGGGGTYGNTWFQNVSGLWQNNLTGQTLAAGETPTSLTAKEATSKTTASTATAAQPVQTDPNAVSY